MCTSIVPLYSSAHIIKYANGACTVHTSNTIIMVGKFRESKVSHFVSLFHIHKILCGILFRGEVLHPTNYIGVKGVKF